MLPIMTNLSFGGASARALLPCPSRNAARQLSSSAATLTSRGPGADAGKPARTQPRLPLHLLPFASASDTVASAAPDSANASSSRAAQTAAETVSSSIAGNDAAGGDVISPVLRKTISKVRDLPVLRDETLLRSGFEGTPPQRRRPLFSATPGAAPGSPSAATYRGGRAFPGAGGPRRSPASGNFRITDSAPAEPFETYGWNLRPMRYIPPPPPPLDTGRMLHFCVRLPPTLEAIVGTRDPRARDATRWPLLKSGGASDGKDDAAIAKIAASESDDCTPEWRARRVRQMVGGVYEDLDISVPAELLEIIPKEYHSVLQSLLRTLNANPTYDMAAKKRTVGVILEYLTAGKIPRDSLGGDYSHQLETLRKFSRRQYNEAMMRHFALDAYPPSASNAERPGITTHA